MPATTDQVPTIHHSFWTKQTELKQRYPRIEAEHETDVLIIGGGITGLSLADELTSRSGMRVTVCDANVIGGGTTGASSGHLDPHPEMGPVELMRRLGATDARTYTSLRLKAIDRIMQRAAGQVEITPVVAFQYTECIPHLPTLREECKAAQQLGLPATWCDDVPLNRAVGGYQIAGLGRMDSLQYVVSLADKLASRGVQIFELSQVAGPTEKHPTSLAAGNGTVRFKQVVCAAHSNITNSMRLYLETPAYQSYCLVARVADPPIDALFWDDATPYHYVRRVGPTDDNLVLIGGCDHRTGAGEESLKKTELEQWTRERFAVQEVLSRWSAELFEPTDGLPLIGRVAGKDNVWIATGLSGVGLTLGTVAGELLAHEILGNPRCDLAERLTPSRFGISNVANFLSEQTTSAANYAERVLPSHELTPQDLKPGEGQVGKLGGEFVAICRDRDGCEHRVNPICSHMGGVVHWNEEEQTWDCPVHGGRFRANGERLYGPPDDGLNSR